MIVVDSISLPAGPVALGLVLLQCQLLFLYLLQPELLQEPGWEIGRANSGDFGGHF